MAGRSEKHMKFVDCGMGSKPVTDVPGIGNVIGKSLKEDGVDTAKKLYSKYLADPDKFKNVVKSHGGNAEQQREAYDAMEDWDQQHN